jgi:hypothetical protein
LGFIIEEVKAGFPDCIARRQISGRHKSPRAAHAETKEFFLKHRLQPGDEIEIARLSRYEYRIKPAK